MEASASGNHHGLCVRASRLTIDDSATINQPDPNWRLPNACAQNPLAVHEASQIEAKPCRRGRLRAPHSLLKVKSVAGQHQLTNRYQTTATKVLPRRRTDHSAAFLSD